MKLKLNKRTRKAKQFSVKKLCLKGQTNYFTKKKKK